eukprot:3524912-Rhodomonas_salina.1
MAHVCGRRGVCAYFTASCCTGRRYHSHDPCRDTDPIPLSANRHADARCQDHKSCRDEGDGAKKRRGNSVRVRA